MFISRLFNEKSGLLLWIHSELVSRGRMVEVFYRSKVICIIYHCFQPPQYHGNSTPRRFYHSKVIITDMLFGRFYHSKSNSK